MARTAPRSSRTEELEVLGEAGVEGLHVLQLQLWLHAAKFLCPIFLGKPNFQRVESGGKGATGQTGRVRPKTTAASIKKIEILMIRGLRF